MIVYFDAIRRAGSVREAARRLNIASSAVNRQLLKLEAELGTPLFERLSSGLKLTHAGTVFARHVMGVLQDAERFRSELDSMKGMSTGHVELAAVEALSADLLPMVLLQIRERYPRITTSITTMGSAAITKALAVGDADLGVAFSLDKSAELTQLSNTSFKLGAVMKPDHPLAQRETLTVSTCMAHPLIIPKADLSIRQTLLRSCTTFPYHSIEASSVDLMKHLTLKGLGISFQTRIGIERELEQGELIHIPLKTSNPVRSDLGVYVRAGRNPSVAILSVAQLLDDEIKRRAAIEAID
jgi:DNA-binding transcriptional LysR family regulator